ncbi:hypothetical protein [Lutibacter flavus]|uniref:Uncharacterized protein n=1 Tax=Lutibacter flavus TaxID=691689 RepID=A0A238WWF9_9FLAO|nr:hypothetical protein [Lutibacter flavus]SNR50830.1 hypothetical protein SAMN04488111_1273 [Lutibacter flavus]
MRTLSTFILFTLVLFQSCQSQEKMSTISLNYSAQTRGFTYSIQLEKNTLKINDNNVIKKVELSKIQLLEINQALDKIDFSEIENNISIDDLAVDKAIKGTFKVHFRENVFKFELNHNKLPKNIQELFRRLEAYLN